MDAQDAAALPHSWDIMRAEERAEQARQVELDAARDARIAAVLGQNTPQRD